MFHESSIVLSDKMLLVKYFEGKIFINGNQFMKNFPSKKPATVNRKSLEGENFRGFCGFMDNRETFIHNNFLGCLTRL